MKKSKCSKNVSAREEEEVAVKIAKKKKNKIKKSWVTEMLVCMIWFLFTPLSVPGEREMLTDEGRQKSDEGLERGVNELFPQAVLLTMRVSIEPLMTGGCSIAHTLTTPTPPPRFLCLLYIATHCFSKSVALYTRAVSSYSQDQNKVLRGSKEKRPDQTPQ